MTAQNPFSLWEKVATSGVEGRPSFDGLWRRMSSHSLARTLMDEKAA